MKKNIILLLFLSALQMSFAQSYETIRNSSEYLSGEGFGSTLNEANENALADLISQISVNVESSFSKSERQSTEGGYGQDVEHIVRTFSTATLNNTGRIVISNEPDAHVLRYIRKSEISRIFEGRKDKVTDMVRLALAAEEKTRIDDALRYYYWAYCLLRTLPHPNELTYRTQDGKDVVLTSWIPDRMRSVFNDIDIIARQGEGYIRELSFFFRKKPASSIDYTYFDGMDWSNIYSARDGRGIVEFRPDMIPENLQVKCEYEFRGEAHIDDELRTVMGVLKTIPFRDAYFNVDLKALRPLQTVPGMVTSAAVLSDDKVDAGVISDDGGEEYFNSTMEAVCSAIENRTYETVRDRFTAEGWATFSRIIGYGRARLFSTGTQKVYTFLPMGDKTICRSLPMTFSFATNNKVFTENVTFTFDKDKKIENLAFSLGIDAERDILTKGDWDRLARLALMNFLEDYKTAYALKDLGYIENVFDENAVIITGKVFRRAFTGENGIAVNKDMVKYTRYTKDEFLKRLELSFASKEYINIRFANNDVQKMGTGGEVYAVQIKQDYFSSNYGDTGYLFLLVDINDPDAPVIKVRTWQPERDPDYGIIGPEDF